MERWKVGLAAGKPEEKKESGGDVGGTRSTPAAGDADWFKRFTKDVAKELNTSKVEAGKDLIRSEPVFAAAIGALLSSTLF